MRWMRRVFQALALLMGVVTVLLCPACIVTFTLGMLFHSCAMLSAIRQVELEDGDGLDKDSGK